MQTTPIVHSLPSSASALMSSLPNDATPMSLSATSLRTLWLRMAEIYGHRWTSAYGENPEAGAGGTWAKGLAGLSPSQLADGLSASIISADPWPPTLPEFRARCVGIPSFAAVSAEYREVAHSNSRPVSPFARLMYQYLEYGRYREGDRKTADKALRDAYELASDHLLRGGDYPPEPVAVIARAPVPPQPEPTEEERAERKARAEKAMAELHALFFGPTPDIDGDKK